MRWSRQAGWPELLDEAGWEVTGTHLGVSEKKYPFTPAKKYFHFTSKGLASPVGYLGICTSKIRPGWPRDRGEDLA